jgi:hypothetical protein
MRRILMGNAVLTIDDLNDLFSVGVQKPAVMGYIENLSAEDIKSMSQQEVLGLFKSILVIILE